MARPLRKITEQKLPPDAATTVSLRMPSTLRAKLEEAAAEADRTLSSEAMRRLRQSFQVGGFAPKPTQAGTQRAQAGEAS